MRFFNEFGTFFTIGRIVDFKSYGAGSQPHFSFYKDLRQVRYCQWQRERGKNTTTRDWVVSCFICHMEPQIMKQIMIEVGQKEKIISVWVPEWVFSHAIPSELK